MKYAVLALTLVLGTPAFAKKINGVEYYEVTGKDALEDQYINQYDDSDNPPQGYLVTLPEGYSLQAVDVVSNGNTICGVSAYNYRTQTFRIDGFSLETDAQGCEVHLTIWDKAARKEIKAVYSIEQVGT